MMRSSFRIVSTLLDAEVKRRSDEPLSLFFVNLRILSLNLAEGI